MPLAASCKKDNINPEPEHKDVFRCKVNGELWAPAGGDGTWGFDKELLVYYEQEFLNALSISANRRIENTDTIDQFLSVGISLKDSIIGKHLIYNNELFLDFQEGKSFSRDTLYDNFIIIDSIDSIKQVIEGIFNFVPLILRNKIP